MDFKKTAFQAVKTNLLKSAKAIRIEAPSAIKEIKIVNTTNLKVVYIKQLNDLKADISIEKLQKANYTLIITLINLQQIISQFKNN